MPLPSFCPLLRLRRAAPFPHPHLSHQARAFVDARVKWVRDRALDHAVEKEKHLLPFHSLKDLLLSPSSAAAHSLPLSAIAAGRAALRLPFRAIRFIRLFPSAFVEHLPSPPPSAAAPPHPVISPTAALLRLHDDELRTLAASRADAADRLFRLLMLSPSRRLPLAIVDCLRWDLGLPRDFARSLLPNYPDYFQLAPSPSGDLDLEVVCYRKDLAISAMEQFAMRTGGYRKGAPLAFPLQFSRGFDLEKKVRNWLEDWQKLPYISPYEDGSHLEPRSDLAEKWAVGVLHEVLSLLVSKKTEKENLVLLAEKLGLPPGFRKMIVHHPGIFYVSNKLRTQTVVLREAYRRDLLVEKHPLMGLRYQYIHLMHLGKEAGAKHKDRKTRQNASLSGTDYNIAEIDGRDEDYEEDEVEEDDEEEFSTASGADTEDESDDEDAGYSVVHEAQSQRSRLPSSMRI